MAVTFGEKIKIEIFGASHGDHVGVRIEGLPAGKTIDMKRLQEFLRRRAPGRNALSTSRKEEDIPVFISGAVRQDSADSGAWIYVTDGNVFEAIIHSKDVKKEDYEDTRVIPRPSHADYPAWVKYGRIESGGGQFSGRMTAPLCIAGGIFLQWLEEKGIKIDAHVDSIGGIKGEDMYVLVSKMKEAGDSVGGIVKCVITGVPAGIGSPLFGNIESRICQAVFTVPAVKGIEFGNGFRSAALKGSENNDPFCIVDGQVRTKTNNHGGILGGLSSGMPIEFDVAIKPAPSIALKQNSVNLEAMRETTIEINGRHDPCIVPRAVPCIEAAAAIAMGDLLLEEDMLDSRTETAAPVREHRELIDFRREIDRIDKDLVALLEERFDAARDVIRYKALRGMPVLDSPREKEVLDSISGLCREDTLPYMRNNFEKIIAESRKFQQAHRAQYGLLGKNLSHSYSPMLHQMFGGYEYMLFHVPEERFDAFMKAAQFKGINVTMPYKKAVMPYCDEISERARACGSVNTIIRRDDGTLFGDNTDLEGFRYMLETSGISVAGAKVLVLGSGGVSGTIIKVLRDYGAAEIVNISRTGADSYENIGRHSDAQIIVNATPVGMFPHAGVSPVDLQNFPACRGVFDVIYTPLRTKLMLDAEALGIPAFGGLEMLVSQAAEASRLFTGNEISAEKIEDVVQKLRSDIENIVLIGMPGCGKTTVGRALAKRLGRTFIDLDERIEAREGHTPASIINTRGLDAFREIETETLREIVRDGTRVGSGRVIATGGGIVERDENRELLRENGKIIYLERPLEALTVEERPVSQTIGIDEVYNRRHNKYEQWSDFKIENNNVDKAVNIVEQLVCL